MNLSWLDDFLALVASGNFSRAAEERHLTQPAFSRRIRALEEWLGTELVDRSSQPATPTAAGRWFTTVARELVARVARLPDEAREVAEADSTTLRIASTHALSFTVLPGWLRELESRTATRPVSLVSDVMSRCETLLAERRVQFVLSHAHALAPDALAARGCPFVRIGRDTLVPVTAPDASGGPRHRIAPGAQGSPLPLLGYSDGSGLGRILAVVRPAGLEDRRVERVFTAHLASVLRTMAIEGRGLAWLPRTLVADDLAAGRLLAASALPAAAIELEIRLYREPAMLAPAAEQFWCAASGAGDPAA